MLWLGKETTEVTWEPSDKIPEALIQEYEDNMSSSIDYITTHGPGHVSHTLVVSTANCSENPPKKNRSERPIIATNEG